MCIRDSGYTEQSVDKRLKQQTHTADVLYHEEWRGNACLLYTSRCV